MKNSSNLRNVRAIYLLFVFVILGNPINAEQYVLKFSKDLYGLLETQKEIIQQTQKILYDSFEYLEEESLKEIISQDVSSITKFEEDGLLELTLAYLESQQKSFSLSEAEVEKVKLCFEKYLLQILEENTKKLLELNCLRVNDEDPTFALVNQVVSSFKDYENNPAKIFGEILYRQPIIRWRSLSF